MAISSGRKQNELDKFVERADGQTSVAVDLGVGSEINIDANSVDASGLVGKSSGGDFTTAYASATTIDCTNLPTGHLTLIADDIVSIVQVATGGGVTKTYHRDDVVMAITTNTITVTGAAFVNTDTFIVYTNIAGTEISAPTAFRSTAVDETAGVAVKATGGNVYGWNLYNPNTYDVFVKFYNTVAASVVVGTTAVVETVQVPSLGSVVIKQDSPIKSFSTAIAVSATKLVADNDTTAIVSDVFAHVYYK